MRRDKERKKNRDEVEMTRDIGKKERKKQRDSNTKVCVFCL